MKNVGSWGEIGYHELVVGANDPLCRRRRFLPDPVCLAWRFGPARAVPPSRGVRRLESQAATAPRLAKSWPQALSQIPPVSEKYPMAISHLRNGLFLALIASIAVLQPTRVLSSDPADEGLYFERDIRPILRCIALIATEPARISKAVSIFARFAAC